MLPHVLHGRVCSVGTSVLTASAHLFPSGSRHGECVARGFTASASAHRRDAIPLRLCSLATPTHAISPVSCKYKWPTGSPLWVACHEYLQAVPRSITTSTAALSLISSSCLTRSRRTKHLTGCVTVLEVYHVPSPLSMHVPARILFSSGYVAQRC